MFNYEFHHTAFISHSIPVNIRVKSHSKSIPSKIQVSNVQNPSIIPFNPGWFVGIPLLDDYNPQYTGIIPYDFNQQPTEVLNTAQLVLS